MLLILSKYNVVILLQTKKIFTIQGPYSHVREALRKRGWIEKFYKVEGVPPPKKSPRTRKSSTRQTNGAITSDDSDQDDDIDDDVDDDDDGM